MRIGFAGAQGTGKTTLAKAYCHLFPDVVMVESTARRIKSAGYGINRDADPLSQLLTTISRANAENAASACFKHTLSDRTLVDSLAYTAYQISYVWKDDFPEKKARAYYDESFQFVHQHMQKYDKVFYFPPYWGPIADGDRDPDTDYQESIDYIVKALLVKTNTQFVTVPHMNIDNRLKWLQLNLRLT